MQPMTPPTKQSPRRAFFKKRDLWVVAVVLVAALGLWLGLRAVNDGTAPGQTAVVTIGFGAGQTTRQLDLSADGVVAIDAALPVQLEVKDGAVRFVDSVCPDHDCEGFGWLRSEGDWAACLPAGVVVYIEQEGAPPDEAVKWSTPAAE